MSKRVTNLLPKIILVGKGGSGKDYIRKYLSTNRGMTFAKSCTSRPRREGETNEYYYFLSKEEFEEKIQNEEFLQYVMFNGHYYGTLKETFKCSNLFIMNPQGVANLSETDRQQCIVFLVDASESTLVSRMSNREKIADLAVIVDRINIDRETFKDFRDYDLIIDNNIDKEQ